MALFGMVWLLRVRSEMRRCSKCRRDELLTSQQHEQAHEQRHQQQNQHRPLSQATSLLHTPDDGVTMSSANTLFTLDTPGATGPAGSYCEVHGYVAPKEGINYKHTNLFEHSLFHWIINYNFASWVECLLANTIILANFQSR